MKIQHAVILFCLSALFAHSVSAMAGDGSVAFDLHYDSGAVALNEIKLLEREPPDFFLEPEEGYKAEISAFNGSMLYSRKFDFALWAYDNPQVLTETDELLILPYYNYMEEFRLYDSDGELVLTADISEYAVCNQNSVCNPEYGETEKTCAEDCTGAVEKPVEELPEKREKLPALKKEHIIIAALLIILIAAALLAFRAKKKGQ